MSKRIQSLGPPDGTPKRARTTQSNSSNTGSQNIASVSNQMSSLQNNLDMMQQQLQPSPSSAASPLSFFSHFFSSLSSSSSSSSSSSPSFVSRVFSFFNSSPVDQVRLLKLVQTFTWFYKSDRLDTTFPALNAISQQLFQKTFTTMIKTAKHPTGDDMSTEDCFVVVASWLLREKIIV